MSLVRLVKALSLQLQQTYAGSPLSFVTATRNIFKLTLNSEQSTSVSCIHFGKVETAQQSCCHRVSPTMFYIPVVYSPIIYPSCYLQPHLMCHNRKYYGIPRACVISVYQALPPVFQAPGKEASSTTTTRPFLARRPARGEHETRKGASSTTTETSISPITRPQTLMSKTIRWACSLLKQIITVTVNPL